MLRSTRARLVARDGRVDEQRPGVDAAPQVVEIPESLTLEVLGGVLAAYAVVALEDDGRIPIAEQQRIVIRLVEQARAADRGQRALLLGANVDQLDCGAALEQGLQFRRRQLTNRRSLVCRDVIAQRLLIVVRRISFGQIVTDQLLARIMMRPSPVRRSPILHNGSSRRSMETFSSSVLR